jgi:hypothetical protein
MGWNFQNRLRLQWRGCDKIFSYILWAVREIFIKQWWKNRSFGNPKFSVPPHTIYLFIFLWKSVLRRRSCQCSFFKFKLFMWKKSDNLKMPKRAPIYIIVCIYNKKQSLIKTMTLSTPASSDALSSKKIQYKYETGQRILCCTIKKVQNEKKRKTIFSNGNFTIL